MLEVADLRVQYGQITGLDGVSLRAEAGEAVGVVGPNGAGKSSLLNAVAGLVKPSRGSIAFEGRSILGTPVEEIVALGISLVPEGRRIFGPLTVAENLALGATAVRSKRARREGPDVEEMLTRFPTLKRLYRNKAGNLSGGEQQMLAIARALMAGPRLLLMDEPSLGLAPLVVEEVFNSLEGLRSTGVTVLLVEQNALRTVEFCDRTYVLRLGQVVLTGEREKMLAEEDFSSTYLGAST